MSHKHRENSNDRDVVEDSMYKDEGLPVNDPREMKRWRQTLHAEGFSDEEIAEIFARNKAKRMIIEEVRRGKLVSPERRKQIVEFLKKNILEEKD